MALILSIETSATICSCAIHKDGQLIKERAILEPQAHASKLAVLIKNLCADVSIEPKQLSAIAVSSGPGSYTGLRIGTSTVKGLCYALNLPLIAIPTLELLVSDVVTDPAFKNFLFCPMIDARRMEVFCQITDSNGAHKHHVEALEIEENTFTELLEHNRVLFLGDGAAKCKGVIKHANAVFKDDVVPTAALMGRVALNKFKAAAFEDLISFVPFYLKEFQAKKAPSVFN